MKSLYKYSAVLVFVLLLQMGAKAQHYPVQANLSVGTPCPQRLSSLFPLSSSRLQLQLLLTDIAQAEVSVRLHVKIEGAGLTVQSGTNPAMPVFMLQGGMPLTLGQEMEPYFRANNLVATGNGAMQFMQNGLLPEGFFTFTVTVIEHRRNVQISNAAQGFVWVIVNDPPQLVTPENNQILEPGGMQNIFFSWLPRHVVNPSSGSPIRYALSLWEVPQGMNAQMVVNTLPPLESVETPSTSLVWGTDRMPLTPGKHYVTAVKAFDPNNEVGFKNNGLSVPHSFVYGQSCLPPVNLAHSNITTQSADISWLPVGLGQNFRLEFKASGEAAGAYRLLNITGSHVTLSNLAPNTSYDYRLSTVCGSYVSQPTSSRSFSTLPIPPLNNECLSTVEIPTTDQSPLLTSLPAGQLFMAAGFPVEVGWTEPAGPNTFNGRGIVTLPLFGFGLHADLEQIKVNQALQLVSGVVRVVKGDSLTTIGGSGSNGGDGPGGVDFSNPNDTIFIPLPIDSVYANVDSTWSIVDTDGNITIVTPSEGGTLVVGPDGNGVVIIGGQAYPVSTNQLAGGGIPGSSLNVTGICSQQVSFSPGGSMHKYGFDGYKEAMPPGSYPVINVGDEQLHLPWKSVATGGSDRLFASPLTDSLLSFAYEGGMPLSATTDGDGYQLWSLNPPGEEDNLLALCQADSTGNAWVAGGVRVKSYPLQRQRLVVVPVGSSQASFTKAQLQTDLNAIYAQAVCEWEVSIDAALPLTGIDDLSQGITVGETDYSEHMRQVWRALVMDRNPVPGATYLFIIPGFKDHPAMTGYMPLKSGYGFLTPQADTRTAAHELGHGAFNLRHTFSNDNPYKVPEGTQNLMDYAEGTELWKYQWDYIHNPEGGWFVWEDIEEGAGVTFGIVEQIVKNEAYVTFSDVSCHTFFTPAGYPITFSQSDNLLITSLDFVSLTEYNINVPSGALFKFKLNGEQYRALYKRSSETYQWEFLGYKKDSVDLYYNENLTKDLPIPYQANIFISGSLVTQLASWDINSKYLYEGAVANFKGSGEIVDNVRDFIHCFPAQKYQKSDK